ncbi:MAG: DUF1707 domain-containing protein [Micromonosporaceae bacterium]|nr:DUF1707 domain-containing protein [Micromonosporaceae bacterium]
MTGVSLPGHGRERDNGGVPSSAADQPASNEDRERALQLLRVTGTELGLEELEQRLDAAVQARTVGDLATLLWDLDGTTPPPSGPAPRVRIWRSAGFRYHAITYGLTNGFFLGTWAITGADFFWPFFPAAGWGIALGLHATAAHAAQLRKQQRAAQRAIKGQQLTIGPMPVPPPATAVRPVTPSPRSSVVVMFTDVVDSTRLTEVIGDDEWARVRARHLGLLRDCYGAHRGTEVTAQGDGFMAQFVSPVEAVQCAVEIQRRLQTQRDEAGFALPVRIGMHTGEAVVATNDLLGTVINMAARVMSEAAPGEVLITETLADQLDARFELDDRGLRTLKGFTRPRHLLAVCWGG